MLSSETGGYEHKPPVSVSSLQAAFVSSGSVYRLRRVVEDILGDRRADFLAIVCR